MDEDKKDYIPVLIHGLKQFSTRCLKRLYVAPDEKFLKIRGGRCSDGIWERGKG
jgi:hypothetical protein